MAVLLIALATSITIAIVAVAEEADAAMYDVDLSYKDASPIRVAQALNPVVFNFTLEHTGDTLSEEVKVELLNEPPLWQHVFRANTRTGFVISTSTLEVLLQRGEIASLTLTVTVPLNQLNQTYWMTVKTYPKKDTSRSETFIIGVIVPQVADFALELWDPPVDDTYTGIGPTSVTIQLALYNSGNGADHFLIEGNSSLAGEGWLLTFESGIDEFGFTPNITPDPAKRTPYFIVVHVDIPADALGGIMSMVSFEVTSMFNPSVMRTQVLAAVKSLQFAGFEIEVWNIPPDGVYRAIPPSVVTIRFALYNTGNGGDRFLIQAECSRSDEGWKLTFVQGVDEYGFTPNLTADPNKRSPHFIDVKVNIPANTRAGVTAQIVINATSMFNLSKQMPPAFAQVEALQYYNFDAFIEGVDSKEGIPGETVTFQARIWNKGNGWDEFSITPIWDEDLNPGFIASTDPRSMAIAADDNGTFDYIVVVPMAPPKKVYFFTVEIQSSSEDLSPITKSFAVEVGQYFGLSLSCDQPLQTTVLGGILDYEVVVTNTGNGLDSFIIDMDEVPQGWTTYVQPPEVSLLQAQHATVVIRVLVPARYDEVVPAMEYDLVVVADSSRSDAEASLAIHAGVEQFHRIEWTLLGDPLTDPDAPATQAGVYKPRPVVDLLNGTTTTFHLGVKNFGNGPDTVALDWAVDDPRLSVTLSPSTVDLETGVEQDVTVTVQVPSVIPWGIYELWVYARSENPSVDLRSVHLDFEVVQFYSDTEFGDLHYTDLAGDDYTFNFEASKAGGAVDRASGEIGLVPGVDIVSLDAMMDPTTGAVSVEVEFSGPIVDDATTEYWIFFVEGGHRQTGVLLAPEEYHDGAFNWTFSDQGATVIYVFLMDGVGYMGSAMEPVDVALSGGRMVFTIPADSLLRLGLEPDSGFGVYAYAHVLETSSEEGWSTMLTWDSAGEGAAAAPDEFSYKPNQDGSPMGTFLAPLAMVVAVLAAFGCRGRKNR